MCHNRYIFRLKYSNLLHLNMIFYCFIYIVYLILAILHYRTFPNNTKQKLKNQHALIHGCILILIVIAGFAAFVSHQYSKPQIPHLYSLHSWLGVITIIMFLSQVSLPDIYTIHNIHNITFFYTLYSLLVDSGVSCIPE